MGYAQRAMTGNRKPPSAIHKWYGLHEVPPRTTVDATIVAPVTLMGRPVSRPDGRRLTSGFSGLGTTDPAARHAAGGRPTEQ
jgi:hypothetical protein